MSGLLPVTEDRTINRVIQYESAGSIPGTRGQSTTCPHCYTSTNTSHHFRIHHRQSFFAVDRQSHGQTSAILWCGGGVQWFTPTMLTLYRDATSSLYPERSKVSFLISLLSGKALQWAETIWAQAGNITQSLDNFVSHFREVFGRPRGDPTASDRLYHLQQGSQPIKEYALRFRTLAAASGWNERSLITTYRQGLEPRLRLQMASYDDNLGLETMIQHSIRCSFHMHLCFDEQTSWNRCTPSYRHPETPFPAEPESEPMQTETMRLAPAERVTV